MSGPRSPGPPAREPAPIDQLAGPDELTAHVVCPGRTPKLLGYDVHSDLARHYGFVDVLGLCFAGRLLEPEAARALEIALVFLAPITVAEGPGHAALLGRVCGAPFRAVVGLAAVTLAEEAAAVLALHEPWLEWLRRAETAPEEPPTAFLAHADEEREAVARLEATLADARFAVRALEVGPTPTAALLAVLAACGLGVDAMTTAWVLARLATAAAEAAARPPLGFRDYPVNLPPIEPEAR